jgi:hypothetical protein
MKAVSLTRMDRFWVGVSRNTEFGGYVQCFQWDGRYSSEWNAMGSPILNLIAPKQLIDRFDMRYPSLIPLPNLRHRQQCVARVAIGAPWKDFGNVPNSEWWPFTNGQV